MPPMPIDRAFSRRAGFQAYLIAAFSLVYAVVFLGFVRNHPENIQAAALAWALIAGAGLSATIATTSAAARIGGDARWWLTALGVGYGLLSAAHGTFAAIAVEQGIAATDLSPTDPRGLAGSLVGSLALGLPLYVFARPFARIADLAGDDLYIYSLGGAAMIGYAIALALGIRGGLWSPMRFVVLATYVFAGIAFLAGFV